MASVCEESLALLGCDVMLMGIISTHKGKATVSVIGRCAAQATRRQVCATPASKGPRLASEERTCVHAFRVWSSKCRSHVRRTMDDRRWT